MKIEDSINEAKKFDPTTSVRNPYMNRGTVLQKKLYDRLLSGGKIQGFLWNAEDYYKLPKDKKIKFENNANDWMVGYINGRLGLLHNKKMPDITWRDEKLKGFEAGLKAGEIEEDFNKEPEKMIIEFKKYLGKLAEELKKE